MIHATVPSGPRTGVLIGLHQRSSNLPGSATSGMSYLCAAIVSGSRELSTRRRDALRLSTPSASGSAGLSGNASKMYCPIRSSRVRRVASRYARLTLTMTSAASSTRYGLGVAAKSAA